MDGIATSLINIDFHKSWQKTSSELKTNMKTPLCVNGVRGKENIANEFRNFLSLAGEEEAEKALNIKVSLKTEGNSTASSITPLTVERAVKEMATGKATGHVLIALEHIKYAGPAIHIILAKLFSNILRVVDTSRME